MYSTRVDRIGNIDRGRGYSWRMRSIDEEVGEKTMQMTDVLYFTVMYWRFLKIPNIKSDREAPVEGLSTAQSIIQNRVERTM